MVAQSKYVEGAHAHPHPYHHPSCLLSFTPSGHFQVIPSKTLFYFSKQYMLFIVDWDSITSLFSARAPISLSAKITTQKRKKFADVYLYYRKAIAKQPDVAVT